MSESWVVAARFINVGEAEAALSALDAAGIACDLADANLVGIDWGVSQAVGGIKVIVRGQDLDEARTILTGGGAPQSSAPDSGAGEDTGAPPISTACPACGSPEIEPISRLRLFVFLAVVFIGIGVAVGQTVLALTGLLAIAVGVLLMPSMRCRACDHRWNAPPSGSRAEAPLPDLRDTIEEACPRCGSLDVYSIDYRRMKAIPLLFNPAILVVFPMWLLQPKRRCESCGLKIR